MKKIFIYIFALTILTACSKDEEKAKTSGEVMLSSQILGNGTNYYVEGFLLEQAKKVSYSLTSSPLPDLVLENNLDLQGANLTSPQNNEAFYLLGEFNSLPEAQASFNNLTEAGTYTFAPKVNGIKSNQVFVFKSRSNRYAKLLIKDYQTFELPFQYVQITIEWVYQANGGKTFNQSK
jgi:hypothetical protein